MNEVHTDQLFEGILQSAHTQAEAIIARAEQDVLAVDSSYEKKIHSAVDQEKRLTEKRLEQIQRLEESTVRNLERKHEVSTSERLRTLIMSAVVKKMAALVGSSSYRTVLIGWIAEAAIGLDKLEAMVSCSFKESIDDSMLREAERLITQSTGKQVQLHLNTATLTGQGIEVTSLDGKIAYNNQVSTRLIRHERKLKELMEGQPCRKE